MGIYVKIRKILNENNNLYYLVEDEYHEKNFYISINLNKKNITFYNTKKFVNPIKTIDLTNPEEIFNVPGIDGKMLGPVIIKVIRALNDNDFPEIMDYCS